MIAPVTPRKTLIVSTAASGSEPPNASEIPTSGCADPGRPQVGRPAVRPRRIRVRRIRGEADRRDQERDDHDDADPREEAPRQRLPRLARLGRQVRDGLEPGEGEHREREREDERVPGRRGAEVDSLPEALPREQEGESEADDEQVREEGEDGDEDRGRVHPGTAHEADPCHAENRDHAEDDIPRRVREGVPAECRAEVVRHEEAGQRDDDQVVEEERPAGDEPRRVVERAPHEGRGAAGLRQRRGSLRVRERDEEEERPDAEQHPGRGAERVERDDAEREVDRRPDLAVGDRRERARTEHPRQTELLRHQSGYKTYSRPAPATTSRAPKR